MMVWDDVIGIGMQRLSEEAITNAARRQPGPRACFSCNEISVAATSNLPLETRIAFFWRNGRKKCTHFLPFLSVFFSPQIPQEGAIFSRAPFWLILRLVRPISTFLFSE